MNKLIKKKQNSEKDSKVKEIIADYERRKAEKQKLEQSWLLNINFLVGNQYSYISPSGEAIEQEKVNGYETREVFNHIAPIVESRLAKLGKVRPSVAVRPASISEKDREVARLTKAVIDAASVEIGLPNLIKKATIWSEVCGTCFYKVLVSNSSSGFEAKKESEKSSSKITGDVIEKIDVSNEAEGSLDVDLKVCVVSPFEIFPSDNGDASVDELASIIHARAISRKEAEESYGITGLKGGVVKSLSMDLSGGFSLGMFNQKQIVEKEKDDHVLVIERYTKNASGGTLEIVVGDTLVYDGEMPFGKYPFVKQVSSTVLGSFWGGSIVDRCIPVQRAYNAVKNRKIDYLSRLTTGVMVAEEGSVDVDELVEDGLKPGKVVVYRAGANMPRLMDTPSLPPELSREEDRLLNELITLTGVSELMRNSMLPSSVTSGTAINLLSEADDNRLSVAAEQIRASVLDLTRLMLEIFKAAVSHERITRLYDERGRVQLFYWKGSDLSSEDVVLDTENELSTSIASRRQMVIDLLKMGVFNGENGKINEQDKAKILEMVGFGNYEAAASLNELHETRAKEENLTGEFLVLEVDNHACHIAEHTRLALNLVQTKEDQDKLEQVIMHIREHKAFVSAEKNKSGI